MNEYPVGMIVPDLSRAQRCDEGLIFLPIMPFKVWDGSNWLESGTPEATALIDKLAKEP